jgi:hypothetical protein
VVEEVSLADLVSGELPAPVKDLIASPDAWLTSSATKEHATRG